MVVVAGELAEVAGDFAVAGEAEVAGDFVVAADGDAFAEPCAKVRDAGSAASKAIVRMSLIRFIIEWSFLFLMVERSSSGMRDP